MYLEVAKTFQENKGSGSWHLSPHPHQWILIMSVGSLGHLYCRLLIGTCLAKWGLHTNWIKCQQYPIMGTNLQCHYGNIISISFTTHVQWAYGYCCYPHLFFYSSGITIWLQRFDLVMACCLMAPSHYLIQCYLTLSHIPKTHLIAFSAVVLSCFSFLFFFNYIKKKTRLFQQSMSWASGYI